MIKDESVRESTPEKRNPSVGRLSGQALLTFGFSAAQVWAASVLADADLSGSALVALSLVLSAAFIAVLDGWREVWSRAAGRRLFRDCGRDADSRGAK
ncbi:hypothetical protein [Saccharopolyspora phatthalungensis]|uniref:Uncharacterized protein n=1 Tax=Saccharopolyspora phatthalungensis TaxID=664693 RepID=A0A840Q6Z2_9PSEU|nr:hypothetical protein [Saccharopolyspora phatthalungensis]MBB5156424.1 hypothetical protein [Saccharopolyspora phatthalungensis]